MILSELKRYTSQHGVVSLCDMSIHFDTEPDALRGMLEHWMQKGKVRRHSEDGICKKSCSKCDPATIEFYEWTG